MATLGLVVFWGYSSGCVEHHGHWEQYLGTALPKNCLSAEGIVLCAPMDGDSLLHPSRSPWLGLMCQLCCGELLQHPACPPWMVRRTLNVWISCCKQLPASSEIS